MPDELPPRPQPPEPPEPLPSFPLEAISDRPLPPEDIPEVLPADPDDITTRPAWHEDRDERITAEPPDEPGPPPEPGFFGSIGLALTQGPHPGFLFSGALSALLVLVVVILGVGIAIVMIVVQAVRDGDLDAALQWASTLESDTGYLVAAFSAQHLAFILGSWLLLRILAGRHWAREVALRRPGIVHVILVTLVFPGLSLVASGLYGQLQKVLPGLDYFPAYALTVIAVSAGLFFFWAISCGAAGRDLARTLTFRPLEWQMAGTVLVSLVVLAVAGGVFLGLRPHIPRITMLQDSGMMEKLVEQVRQWPPAVAVLLIGVGPGIGEELWCRAFLGRGLVGRYGLALGVTIASFLFGAIHGDPHQGTMAAVMGLGLHYVYITTRSLWMPILLHTLNNSFAVVADKLPDVIKDRVEKAEINPNLVDPLIYGAGALLVLTVGWALYSSRARLVRVDGADLPPWQPPFPGVAYPPRGSGTAVVHPWPGALPTLAVGAGVGAMIYAIFLS